MYSDISVSGVVMKSTPVGETDRRLELLTRERGKMVVFSRGCRRPTSPLLAYSRPFCFAKFQISTGKNNYLKDADAIAYFDELTQDYESLVYASYFMEFAAYFVQEEMDSSDVLNLLYLAMKSLTREGMSKKLVRLIYEMRMLTINGEAPHLLHCLNCGKPLQEQPAWFHMRRSGAFCADCAKEAAASWYLDPVVLYTLQYMEEAPLDRLFAFSLTEEVLKPVEHLVREYLKHYVDATFVSLEMLPNS